jgi:uncharacterized protein YuzE
VIAALTGSRGTLRFEPATGKSGRMVIALLILAAPADWTAKPHGTTVDVLHKGKVVFRAKAEGEFHYTFTKATMVDIDGDGALDLIAYGNEEIDRVTYVYLQRGDGFVKAYTHEVDHDTLVDLNHDGKLELIAITESHDGLDCDLDKKSASNVASYAKKVVIAKAAPKSYPMDWLGMLAPIDIYVPDGDKLVKAPVDAYADFRTWRAGILEQAARADNGCRPYFEKFK